MCVYNNMINILDSVIIKLTDIIIMVYTFSSVDIYWF